MTTNPDRPDDDPTQNDHLIPEPASAESPIPDDQPNREPSAPTPIQNDPIQDDVPAPDSTHEYPLGQENPTLYGHPADQGYPPAPLPPASYSPETGGIPYPPTPGTAPQPAGPPPEPAVTTVDSLPPGRIRMRTVALGLILFVIACTVLLGELTSVAISPGVVVLILMIGTGLLLIAGARRSSTHP